ncbi:MAG: amidohydrolase family protein [Acidobacteria bacterium]|nr:amidohydrolase family protein [Acidobacteriota bacterium]
MKHTSPKIIHRARFVLIHPELLLENAAVPVSEEGRVLEPYSLPAIKMENGAELVDWGDAIILPGLVNAHIHLELTALHRRLTEFSSFTDWALRLIHERRTWTPEDYRSSTEEGARLALASGTTLVGDIASGSGWDALSGGYPRRVVFEETLGPAPGLAEPAMAKIHALFDQADCGEARPLQVHAVSPHAPYSTSGELYRRAAEFAQSRKTPWTTHVAETPEELRFFETGGGEFREFLIRLGVLPENRRAPGTHPVAWLDELGILGPSCLLAHCNYLNDDAVKRIARSKSSVVYCPRSHAFFGHENHPVRRLLDAGVPVALGTDSLASNDSLSMIDEMRHLYARRKDLAPVEILRGGTVHGAAALGFADRLGRLTPGFLADMAVLDLPPGMKSSRLTDQVLEGAGSWRATIINGRVAAIR